MAGNGTDVDYVSVTEISGEPATEEQVRRLAHRYAWSATFCSGKDVVEAACGSGAGLGMLERVARGVIGGDLSAQILGVADRHYRRRVPLVRFDAQRLPLADGSRDVIILHEALYYLAEPERFVAECARVLRPGGVTLISTANKDLYDFNPSPHSCRYFGAVELQELLGRRGFEVEVFGYLDTSVAGLRQRLLRPAKAIAARTGLIPGSFRAKRLLKRLVFGRLIELPSELDGAAQSFEAPTPVAGAAPDRVHKVLYCAARRVQSG